MLADEDGLRRFDALVLAIQPSQFEEVALCQAVRAALRHGRNGGAARQHLSVLRGQVEPADSEIVARTGVNHLRRKFSEEAAFNFEGEQDVLERAKGMVLAGDEHSTEADIDTLPVERTAAALNSYRSSKSHAGRTSSAQLVPSWNGAHG